MNRYRFEGIDRRGLVQTGRVEAESRAKAMSLAGAGGLRVTRLDLAAPAESIWTRDLFGTGKVKEADVLTVVKDLATLVDADLTIDRALRLVIRQAPKSMTAILEAVLADVLAGLSLSRALAKHPKAFPRDVVEVAAAGELTGTLGPVLADLAISLGRAQEIRRTIVSALIYPSLLLVMALGIVGLVVGVLVPSLEAALRPARHRAAGRDRADGAHRGLFGELLAAPRRRHRARRDGARPHLAPAGLRRRAGGVPLPCAAARARSHRHRAGRICRSLGTLLAARVPVPAALAAARLVPRRIAFRRAVDEAARRIPEGARLASALSGLQPLSPLTLQMIATGEEVNRVPDMLMRAAELHEEQVRLRIDRLFTAMTPIITALLGLVVGGLILSIMSAIFSVNDLATR